mmetsp:Transcript_13741/g.40623  ORF Transcript_13741/g.40623 Transcript_13741/m.40623 type:complete len:221 (+) Transcript_13741:1787-2449(+)
MPPPRAIAMTDATALRRRGISSGSFIFSLSRRLPSPTAAVAAAIAATVPPQYANRNEKQYPQVENARAGASDGVPSQDRPCRNPFTSTARDFIFGCGTALDRLRAGSISSMLTSPSSSWASPALAALSPSLSGGASASRRPKTPMPTRLSPTAISETCVSRLKRAPFPLRPPLMPKATVPRMKLLMLWPSPQTAPTRAARNQRCPMQRGRMAAKWSGPEI